MKEKKPANNNKTHPGHKASVEEQNTNTKNHETYAGHTAQIDHETALKHKKKDQHSHQQTFDSNEICDEYETIDYAELKSNENHKTHAGHAAHCDDYDNTIDQGKGYMNHNPSNKCPVDNSTHDHNTHNHNDHDHNTHDHNGHDHNDHDHSDHDHSGHDHSGHAAMYKRRFFISLIFGLPILIFSPMMGVDLPITITFPGSQWVVAILATALFFYGGFPFLQGAKDELKVKKPAMMTLVSLGITVSYLYSVYAFISNNIIGGRAHIMDFFWELSSLILIMLLGHWIEMNAVTNAGSALKHMADLLPNEAHLVKSDNSTVQVPLTQIKIGDQVKVLPGERIPTDGLVISGTTYANESMVTGESRDVKKQAHSQLIGGSINGSGTVLVKVTGTGKTSYLNHVMDLVKSAEADKSRAESLSDRAAGYLFYFALIVGLLSFIIWITLNSGVEFALERLVTVLVIACPHALGLAIPLVSARSTSIAAQNGLLIQNRQALETARKVDIIVMDKTGTLTEGNFSVNSFTSYKTDYTDRYILQLMGALETGSSHPLAVGTLEKLEELNLEPLSAQNITSIPGSGISGTINNLNYKLINAAYLKKHNIYYDEKQFDHFANQGNSISYLVEEDASKIVTCIGMIAQGDQIKNSAVKTIAKMKELNIKPIMLTGDNQGTAEIVGNKLGIQEIKAEARPEDKGNFIAELQERGNTVMMVGDGINDALGLTKADIGMAIGAGTDVAIDSADIVLSKSDPADIIHFLELARNTTRKTMQNLWWGAGYNIVAVPLAAGILAKWGFILPPAVGAVLMSLSTIIVAVNALTLKINKFE